MKIAIASGKGGTGKTTVSTNLAALLSETHEVVLADLDVEEPNSGLFIDGNLQKTEVKYKMIPQWKENSCTFCGKCQEVCNFHAAIRLGDQIMIFPELCHSCYACSELCPSTALPMIPQRMGELKYYNSNKLHFIESRLDIGQEQAVPLIAQTKEFINDKFNTDTIKIFDSPPGTSCPVIEATKDADYIILVTEPTPFGLHDLKLAIKTMQELNKPFSVLINRYGIGNSDVEDYCIGNDIEIIGRIPNSRNIAELYSKARIIYKENDDMRLAITQVKDRILNIL